MIPSSCRRFSRFLLNHSLLNHTLREHGIGNLLEAGDIRADNVVTRDFILVGGIVAGPEDVMHGVTPVSYTHLTLPTNREV